MVKKRTVNIVPSKMQSTTLLLKEETDHEEDQQDPTTDRRDAGTEALQTIQPHR